MNVVSFTAQKRANARTAGAKAVRNEGRIPAVMYGVGSSENFSVTHADIKHLVYTPDFKLAEVDYEGQKHKCIIKDIQFHPVTDNILHIDFLKLSDGHPVKVEIPVKFKGVSPGVKEGGSLVPLMRKVKVKTLPEDLVDTLFVDISELELGSSVRVRDLEITDKIEVMSDGATPIAIVEVPRALRSAEMEEEEAAAAAAAEGAEGTEGAEGGDAPAEG